MPETLVNQRMDQRVNHPESMRNTVAALYSQGLDAKEIASETGVNQNTVRTWINRLKLNQTRSRAKEVMKARHPVCYSTVQPATKPPNGTSGRLRGVVSRELEAQVAVLEQNPPESILELKNTPDREGRASMVKRIAETAALVEGWEDQKASGIVIMMESTQLAQESIDTGATVEMLPDPATEAIRALQED